jgi:glutamate-1-semialdehyde 2,1-aminomutase
VALHRVSHGLLWGPLAALNVIDRPGFYDDLNARADYFYGKLNELSCIPGLKGIVQGLGARFGLYFGLEKPTYDYRMAAANYDRKAGKRFFELALDKGLYFHNYGEGLTPMHSGITNAHTYQILDETLNRMKISFLPWQRRGDESSIRYDWLPPVDADAIPHLTISRAGKDPILPSRIS